MSKLYHIGTSGWSYSHWVKIFYPENLEKRSWLSYYARWFDIVEINSTFYRLPFKNMVKGWKNKVPEGFTFAVKGSKVITHKKKLVDIKDDLDRFVERVSLLENKLGPILWQLPPSLRKNLNLLKAFLGFLPKDIKHAIEFRHKSWFNNETYSILEKYNVALCITDSKKFKSPWVETASFAYFRFHGPERLYASEYTETQLKDIAKKILNMKAESFIFFNNDFEGYALKNAIFLKKILDGGEKSENIDSS